MIDSELQIYNDQIFSFCKSIVIKSNLMALQAKEALEKFYGITIEHDSDNPYYQHLCGQYSNYDEPIYIIDDGNKVVLTQELMDAKPWIRKKYNIYGAAFEKLAAEYAGRENFIRLLIMRPCSSMDELLAMEDFTLITYDTSILEEQERYSIVEGLKKFIRMFKTRWLIQEYVYEELYGLDLMSRFYCLLPPYFLSVVRVDNIKTQYAHSFHIWNHLSSFGLDDYRSVLTLDQQLFLYKNIEYLVANTGKHGTLAILIKEILSQNYLSIEPQMIINEYSPNITGESIEVTPYVVSRRFDDTPISQFFTTKTTSIEQFYELLYSYGLATKSDYLNHVETAHRLSLMNHTTLQTKFLELKRSLPQRPYIQLVFSMLVGGIIHMIAAQRLNFNITVIEEKLDFSEALTPKVAFAFLLYLVNKQYGVVDAKIPTKLKAYPYIRNHSSFIDTNIRTLTGVKKISDFININDFKVRFDTLDSINSFNFAEDFCSLSLHYGSLVAEDLRYACENEYGINEAINKLYNQMFIVGNNDVDIYGSTDITIKEWLQSNAYVVYDFILDLEKDENIEISTIINQLIEGFIPSAVLNSPEFNLNVSDYDKYSKLKQLFIQLCSYNVVFLDPNLKNQITYLHDPINMMNSDLSKIIGISEVKMLSYLPLPYPNPYVSGADPKNTGTLNFSAITNDPLDFLYEYKIEFSRNSNFSSIDQIVYGKADMSKHHVRVLPEFEDRILPGIDYYARVSFRSRLFDWEFTEPSEGLLFNSGKIVPPTLNFPQILEMTTSVVIKTPTITQLDNSLTPEFKISTYEEETIEVTGASLLLTAEHMALTYQHADLHIKSRWFAATNPELTDIIHDSGWVDDLYSYQTSWDKTTNANVYFGVKFKGLRFGESEMSNIASFEMRNLKKPVILNVSGEFNPLSTNIFDITSDDFTALGSVVDTHAGSRWLVTIDEACTKVLWDSGWDPIHLEEVTSAPFKDLFSDSYKILTPSISQTPTSGEGYGFKISPFVFIPVVSETTPDSVYVTVQYKGAILGYSDRSDPYRVFSTLQPRGHLVVNVIPEAVVVAGAQWRRKGTTLWRDPGYKEEYLLEGSYTVEFKPIDRWTKPADLDVTITDTLTTTVTGTYTELPHFGSLKINILPEEAALGNGWWRVEEINGVWCQSGLTINDLEPGTYTILFTELEEFEIKAPISVTVVSNQLTEVTTEYSYRGSKVKVTILPDSVVALGAKWKLSSDTVWNDSGYTKTGIPEGTYSFDFTTITDYLTPIDVASVTLSNGQLVEIIAKYGVIGNQTPVDARLFIGLGEVVSSRKRIPPTTVTVDIVNGTGTIEPLTQTVPYRSTTSFTVVGYFIIKDNNENIIVSSTVP